MHSRGLQCPYKASLRTIDDSRRRVERSFTVRLNWSILPTLFAGIEEVSKSLVSSGNGLAAVQSTNLKSRSQPCALGIRSISAQRPSLNVKPLAVKEAVALMAADGIVQIGVHH